VTRALALQGQVFCGVTSALVIASLTGARLEPRHELLATGALVLLLGMPHGAFDVMIARQLFGTAGFKGWALFSLGYVSLSAAVVGVWIVTPAVFLCAFLIVSAFHFAGDPATGVPRLARGLYGGAVIVLPAMWHVEELQGLLGLVAGPDSAALVAPVLSQLALPWLAATMLACAVQFRTSRLAACESAGLAVLSVAAPPLVAFCAYFCLMHSPRHILRALANLKRAEARQAVALALWPTLAVLVAAALVLGLANDLPLEARVMQLVFVGLAALTLPHMLLIERARRAVSSAAPAANN
jgi:Brp/Blh family beta-carotene 15,15'-monooxygenase